MKRIAVIFMVVGALLAMTSADAFAASGARIKPNQLFVGFVNGSRSTATIQMACFGPTFPGQTGHPMAGQHVSVQRSVDIPGGNTGATGTSIVVSFGPTTSASAVATSITLTRYGSKAIPTSLRLPCGGQGVAVFRPAPHSSSAHSDTVNVVFVGQP